MMRCDGEVWRTLRPIRFIATTLCRWSATERKCRQWPEVEKRFVGIAHARCGHCCSSARCWPEAVSTVTSSTLVWYCRSTALIRGRWGWWVRLSSTPRSGFSDEDRPSPSVTRWRRCRYDITPSRFTWMTRAVQTPGVLSSVRRPLDMDLSGRANQGVTGVRTTRALFCPILLYHTLTSLYDENKLCVSYLQSKFTKSQLWVCYRISLTQKIKTTSRGLVTVAVIKCMWLILILQNVIAFFTWYAYRTYTLFRKGTYGGSLEQATQHDASSQVFPRSAAVEWLNW